MRIKMMILLLAMFVVSHCLGLTSEGALLKDNLRLTDFVGFTNRYGWVCPQGVVVSNQTFVTARVRHRGDTFNFDLLSPDGMRLGDCAGGISNTAEEAVDSICDRLMFGCAAPIETVGSAWNVERDTLGNVILRSRCRDENGMVMWDRSEVYRTYGNLYFHITVNTNSTALSALDLALPLIQGGRQNR